MSDMLEALFAHQLELQVSAFGRDPSALTLEQKCEYIDWNLTAIAQEIGEARDEMSWKPWASDRFQLLHRDRQLGEMVDVLHFFINICLALDATPVELFERYLAKRAVNAKRQAEGYEHTTNKCESCGRALDEPHRDAT